jgi:hypothetical protein
MAKTSDSETALITRAQSALSQCNWVVGECAAQWTQKYAKGRTDADFGNLIGLSGDQVYQRRRVWETFADVHETYGDIKWSHFYSALTWDDAAECLQWANENQATVQEMKAWRRAQHGEDLSEPAEDLDVPSFDPSNEYLTAEPGYVQEPSMAGAGARSGRGAVTEGTERPITAAGFARESSGDDYAPFGKGARGAAPGSEEGSGTSRAAVAVDQIVKRITSAIEKCDAAISPEVIDEFGTLPITLQQRLINAVDNLASKIAGLR